MSIPRALVIVLFSLPVPVGRNPWICPPCTPNYAGSVDRLVDKACEEAETYKRCQVNAVMVENMHDIPYVQPLDMGPEIIASMTRICSEIKRVLPQNMPVGIQILAGANKEALAVAHTCKLNFIRAEGFVFSHVGDEGLFNACAGPLLRYRKQLESRDILVFSDIKKKHSSHSLTSDLSIEEVAKAAEFFDSDGVIVTGASTGCPADVTQLNSVKNAVKIPVLVGSGVTRDNFKEYSSADALIIGSYFKEEGKWQGDLSTVKIMQFMEEMSKMK